MTIAVPFNAAVQICRPSPLHDFNDEAWNADGVLKTTNCYTYALNDPRIGWGIPGHLMHDDGVYVPEYSELTPFHIKRGALTDGLIEITRDQALSGQFHAIALRTSYRKEFHTYRLGADGLWHYKIGQTPIDSSTPPVANPEIGQCAWEEFVGYFTIPREGIHFIPQFLKTPSNT